MKIEDQVCSLDQAKKLSHLGLRNGANHFYVEFSGDHEKNSDAFALCRQASTEEKEQGITWSIEGGISSSLQNYLDNYGNDSTASGCIYPAYTVAELGVMIPMPQEIPELKNDANHIFTWKSDATVMASPNNLWLVEYGSEDICNTFYQGRGYSEATSRAAMLILLLEMGAITPEYCNQQTKA